MARVLITGITGFAGSHLAEHLLTLPEVEVFGIKRWRSKAEHIEHIQEHLGLFDCDLRDLTSVTRLIRELKPTHIFHLAAQSYVPVSWDAPAESLSTNLLCNLNVLEAVREVGIDPRIHIAGSSEEYGLVHEDELPIQETNPLRPLSPYAVSKVAQDLLGYQYYMSYQMRIVRTRAFNHTGPRRDKVFACSNFAHQVARIQKGKVPPIIEAGNLESERDFSDVRDIARAYWLALEEGAPGEVYNICSGKSRTIRSVLENLLALADLEVEVRQIPSRMRPSDVPRLRGDNTKFVRAVGWKPMIPFQQTLEDLLDYWRDRV